MLIKDFKSIPSCFITATDTDAGKTYVSTQILKAWQDQGFTVGAFKPIASGAIWQDGHLVSEDALALAEVSGQALSEINPFTFEHAASPHIADTESTFELSRCIDLFEQIKTKYDRVLVEGVGGWCVPLNDELMLRDLALALGLPIIMVARIGLGCINHSLLTVDRIKLDTKLYHGWIANLIEPSFGDAESNIESILNRTTN